MAETDSIMKMAELLANDVFSEFLWTKTGPTNQNWACQHTALHTVKTHPTDVVFFYDEPYQDMRTYIQCDLKSYKKTSITNRQITSAFHSLCNQVTCAEVSDDWQEMYCIQGRPYRVNGMLFIYNHDREFDQDFQTKLKGIKQNEVSLPPGSKVFVLGPSEVKWLEAISTHIKVLRGGEVLPARNFCSYFYPETQHRKLINSEYRQPATIEMLLSPWIIMRFHDPDKKAKPSFLIYMRPGFSSEDVSSLYEFLRVNQVFSFCEQIMIASQGVDKNTPATVPKIFEELNIIYERTDASARRAPTRGMYYSVPEIVSVINTVEIGMRDV